MRPLAVTMQAFGPYADVQTLDFADLRGAGFFLITGPTGSGKTTVLDAMSFALYGDTSGGPEREGGRTGAAMRSDHADPGALTLVRFDFSIGGDLYRVERIPQQERPSHRGSGTTTQKQEATLWALRLGPDGARDVDGAPLATGWAKVSAKAEDVLGFRGEQFRQVVMLPQGRFQQLLEADSAQREQIFRALFDTGHYAAIELALKDEAATLRRAAEKVVTRRDEILRQAETESADDLSERCARLSVEAGDAARHALVAESERDAAQKALGEGLDAAARLRERDAARALLGGLAEQESTIEERRAELDAARRAATVADVARQATEAEATVTAALRASAAAAAAADEAAATRAAAAAALALEISRTGTREHAAAEVTRLQAFVAGAAALAEARGAVADAAGVVVARRDDARATTAAWAAARDQLAALDARWRDAQAGLLATGLADGSPCPVCGSPDHPAPAALPDSAPSGDEIDAARATLEAATGARESAGASASQADAALARAEALATARAEGLPEDLSEPTALAAALAAAERLSAELREAYERAQATERDAEIAVSRREAERAAAAATLAAALETSAAAAARLRERLDAAGFAAEANLHAARRDAVLIDQLAELVDEHARATIRAGERLRLAEDAATGLLPPDVPALDAAATAASAAARDARDAAAALQARAETAERQSGRLGQLADEAAILEERYAVTGRLADVANRRNPLGLSFQSYVLGAFLDDVLVAASERLREMTKSRYSLERTERRSGRKQAAGLGLLAYDAWTGVSRAVTTLSGGEKFMAALALALGLAEVVQAHAGGIRLETVFVDEGFGSLDDESLDLAIDSLMSLNEGGRLVGIISHVSELRERVDARLEVTAGKRGSSACFVVP